MRQFTAVETPAFGDIIRYYRAEPVYQGDAFGGEIHGAVFVGDDDSFRGDSSSADKVFLTKNGRSDLNFLIFHDMQGLDDLYKGGPENLKHFFRVNEGAAIVDPAVTEGTSACSGAYLIDRKNYKERLDCLAGRIDPPPGEGKSCYSYPENWLGDTDETAPQPEMKPFMLQAPPKARVPAYNVSG
ncbi:hypothetical protein [Mesorhizobium sp. CN2-181]|uniref:hypothetical protein n=1 Tax=Mesorhizobium yinganensis TaxID=3157707 RepID=UPI0032B71F46